MTKTILILGGGIGGITTARELRKHLGTQHRIIIIDRQKVHSFAPSFLWMLIGWRQPEAIQRPLTALEKYGIEFRQDTVCVIDPAGHIVETEREKIPYDYLVVALGAELVQNSIPGLSRHATFYTLEGTLRLREQLLNFSEGTIGIVIGGLPYKCPPAPYEAAFLLESYFARRRSGKITIQISTPEHTPLAIAGPANAETLRQMLQNRTIALHTNHHLEAIDEKQRTVKFAGGTQFSYDHLLVVPPHRAPSVIAQSKLAGDNGWIPVDPFSLRTEDPNIYALGDVTSIPLANGMLLPKAGVFARSEAEIVAFNIAKEILQLGMRKAYLGTGYCFLETGNGRAGYLSGNFYAKPAPSVLFHEPSVTYHWGKVMFEKYWLFRQF